MIVFAGVTEQRTRLEVLRELKAKAVMGSFHQLGEGRGSMKRFATVAEFLRTWPTLRILDSGVFTFLRRTGQLRVTAKARKTSKTRPPLTLDDFNEYADRYKAYLREYLDDWDFVVELDVDNIFGADVSRAFRTELKVIAGDKLIPVWHTVAGLSGWTDCYNEFPYIGTGSDKPMDTTFYRRIIDEAHAHGAVVHGFGGTRVDVMHAVPYDTADSTTWLAAWRFGQFGGTNFRRGDTMSGRELSKARQLAVKALETVGATPEELTEGGANKKQLLLATLLLQEREAELPPIPKPRTQRRLIDL